MFSRAKRDPSTQSTGCAHRQRGRRRDALRHRGEPQGRLARAAKIREEKLTVHRLLRIAEEEAHSIASVFLEAMRAEDEPGSPRPCCSGWCGDRLPSGGVRPVQAVRDETERPVEVLSLSVLDVMQAAERERGGEIPIRDGSASRRTSGRSARGSGTRDEPTAAEHAGASGPSAFPSHGRRRRALTRAWSGPSTSTPTGWCVTVTTSGARTRRSAWRCCSLTNCSTRLRGRSRCSRCRRQKCGSGWHAGGLADRLGASPDGSRGARTRGGGA